MYTHLIYDLLFAEANFMVSQKATELAGVH